MRETLNDSDRTEDTALLAAFVRADLTNPQACKQLFCHLTQTVGKPQKYAVWALFGKQWRASQDDWRCIQVAHSADILREIKEDLNLMHLQPAKAQWFGALDKSTPVFSYYTAMSTKAQKYRAVFRRFYHFRIVGIPTVTLPPALNDCNAAAFTEVQYAYRHQALLWYPAPRTNERKMLKAIQEQFSKNKETS